jgi:hypothetical protein
MPSSAVMGKFKSGVLKSGGSGKRVTNPKQAVAIMYSEKRTEAKHGGKYPEPKRPAKSKNLRRPA